MSGKVVAHLKAAHIKTAKRVVSNIPGEMLHRAASFSIVCEGMFHIFHSFALVVVIGSIFVVVELCVMCVDSIEEQEDAGV